jgi:hypothetical protein
VQEVIGFRHGMMHQGHDDCAGIADGDHRNDMRLVDQALGRLTIGNIAEAIGAGFDLVQALAQGGGVNRSGSPDADLTTLAKGQ